MFFLKVKSPLRLFMHLVKKHTCRNINNVVSRQHCQRSQTHEMNHPATFLTTRIVAGVLLLLKLSFKLRFLFNTTSKLNKIEVSYSKQFLPLYTNTQTLQQFKKSRGFSDGFSSFQQSLLFSKGSFSVNVFSVDLKSESFLV